MGAGKRGFQTADQLGFHGPVGVERKAQDNEGVRIVCWKPVRRNADAQGHLVFNPVPIF